MILSDFSYKIFNYDMFLKNFCAKFADYEKKLYLCRNKKSWLGALVCSDGIICIIFFSKVGGLPLLVINE